MSVLAGRMSFVHDMHVEIPQQGRPIPLVCGQTDWQAICGISDLAVVVHDAATAAPHFAKSV